MDILITVIIFLLGVSSVRLIYLSLSRRILWEKYQVERIRREWDTAYFYYQLHQDQLDFLTKEYFFSDFPKLKKTFEKAEKEEIINSLKNPEFPLLPYLDNTDKYIDEVLYNGKPPILRKIYKKWGDKI